MKPIVKTRFLLAATYATLWFWVVICLLPLVVLLAAAFQPTALFRSPDQLFNPGTVTLENFRVVWGGGDFVHFFRNSVIITVSAVILSLVVSAPLAYGLTKLSPRPRQAISFGVLSLRFLPYVVLAIPMYLIFLRFGLSGTRTGLLLGHLTMHLPFCTWLLVGFFDAVPKEIEEAAIIDGCGPFRLFWSVALPMVMPGIMAAAILLFIVSWNEFLFALFLGGYDAQPLTFGIARFVGGSETVAQYGVIAAYGTLIVVPVVLFVFIANRWIVSGMTAGAVKG